MNREQAKREIDSLDFYLQNHIDDYGEESHTAMMMAIKALERTEPKEVIYSGDGYYDGELVYDLAECPECGYEYEEGDIGWGLPFCPKCGQALKWEVEHDQRRRDDKWLRSMKIMEKSE